MIIVITLPHFFAEEPERIVQLLRRGDIDLIHLRKPGSTITEMEHLINSIPSQYHDRLVLHDHHSLAQKYSLHGIHLNSRNPLCPQGWTGTVSRSCHSLEELEKWKNKCDYLSLSPIFDSISKKGYLSAFTPDTICRGCREGIIDNKVLALGGVTFDKVSQVMAMGFGGAMILGDAWKERGDKVQIQNSKFVTQNSQLTTHNCFSMRYSTVLTIAGSDSGGGAGIQADIKTISACGCYAASAITAVTVQNTIGVQAVHPIPTEIVRGQIRAVLTDIGADSIKIGMLQSADVIRCIKEELTTFTGNIVLDPVMVSTSGHRLIEESAVETLKAELLPMASVITPNIPEAEILLGTTLPTQSSLPDAALALAKRYGVSVLLKAGHLTSDRLIDIFYDRNDDTTYELPSVRIDTRNTHGTGCTLSSALAAFLAKGLSMPDAAHSAKEYINNAIISGAYYEIGHGHGPVNHFFKLTN